MRVISLCFFIFFSFKLSAQDYNVKNIPNELKEGAYAVVREQNITVEFLSYNQAKFKEEVAITVLNESGFKYAQKHISYRASKKINKFNASIYDANGKHIRNLRKRDLKDVSAHDGFSLFIDTRVQYYEFSTTSFPFTIKYEVEYSFSTTINLPNWQPISRYNLAVEKSNYTLINHTLIPIRKREYGFELMEINKNESDKQLTYSIENIPAITEEILSPPLNELTPEVNFSPNTFELEGVRGRMENWDDFGKWYYNNLIKDKIDLSESEKQAIVQLVDGIDDPAEKVRILYEYMQTKTRYVNISIGIGGWEPFPASYVSNKSYGDCKALSNYMVSILNAVGIDAFHTIIYADHHRKINMKEDFTSLQGNHMIVNVPLEDETIWLECTSQQTAFNHLGAFTDDRIGLSVTPEGGKIISTKKYPKEINKEIVRAFGEISPNGNLKINYEIQNSGLQYDRVNSIDFLNQSEQEKILERHFRSLPHLKIKSYSIENDRTQAIFKINAEVKSSNYANVVGNNIIFKPISFGNATSNYRKDNNRKFPFEIRYGYTDEAFIEIKIPDGYQLNDSFQPKLHSDEFGSYFMTIEQIDEQTLKIYRKLVVNEGRYSNDKFNDFVEFQRTVSSMDNTKILIEKI